MTVTPDLDARFRAHALRRGTRRRRYDVADAPIGAAPRRRDRPRAPPHLVRPRGRRRRHSRAPSARAAARRAARRRAARARRVLRGPPPDFDLELDLRVATFHEAVLTSSPSSRTATTTYGALAAQVRRPRAARAVGTVMNRNPIPIVLPCHRVLGANGSLTGYGGGLE